MINTINQKPNTIQELFASPHSNTNKALLLIFGVVLISLLLNIFIKIKHHHPDLITNGLITLVIIGAIFVVNNYISGRRMIVLESFDYSNTSI